MVKLTEHNDYNKPIDNKTVAWLLYTGLDQERYIVKAFKYTEGIWVIPSVVGINASKIRKEEKLLHAYNYDYLKTTEEKTNYLKDMNVLFKRIIQTELGQALLEELNYILPNEQEQKVSIIKDYKTESKESKKSIKKYKEIPLKGNVFIQGHYHLSYPFCADLSSYSIIHFSPDTTLGWLHHSDDKYFIADPVMLLLHELIHAFHNMHYQMLEDIIEDAQCKLEEVVTVGGADLKVADKGLELLKTHILKIRQGKISNINKNIKKLEKNHLDSFTKKNNVEYDQKTKKIVTNDTLDNIYLNKIIKEFTEIKFAKQFNLPYRLFYKQTELESFFGIKLQDPSMYSIERGPTSCLMKYKDIPIYPMHRNTLFSNNLLKVASIFSNGVMDIMPVFLYSWDAYVGTNLKKELLKFEDQAIFSKEVFDSKSKEPLKRKKNSIGSHTHCVIKLPEEIILKYISNKEIPNNS